MDFCNISIFQTFFCEGSIFLTNIESDTALCQRKIYLRIHKQKFSWSFWTLVNNLIILGSKKFYTIPSELDQDPKIENVMKWIVGQLEPDMPSYKRVALSALSQQRNTHETNPIHGTHCTLNLASTTMANLTTTTSISSLWYHSHSTKPNSLLNLKSKLQSYPSSTSRAPTTSMAATTATKVIPSIIVGGGRVGKALQQMGAGEDLLVKRGEPVPIDFPGPILVCTRNDDLDAVLQSTPQSRWNGSIIRTYSFSSRVFLWFSWIITI